MTTVRSLVPLALLAAWILPLQAPAAHAAEAALSLRCFAVNPTGGQAGTIDITIERWSTDEERARLRDVLIEKGGDSLLAALQKIKPRTGFVRTSTSLGWDVSFAREVPLPNGGRRIIVATDRPMGFWELRNQTRSIDYDFTLAEIRLGPDGKGEGKLVTAAKVSYNQDTRTIEIENYGMEPVRLTQVVVVGPKGKK
jgi:hypothetical protein